MSRTKHLLILAGSAEARQIAQRVQSFQVRALVSEPPRGSNPMPVPCALHDFATLDGVLDQMRGADVVVDASHGFDGRMSHLGFQAAMTLGLPFLCYARPGWPLDVDRQLREVGEVQDAVALSGARVFSATGWASLPEYAGFTGEKVYLRQTTAHNRPAPFDFVELVFGRAPFSIADERQILRDLRIDTLICRNLGGRASFPKVAAALELGLEILLVARPALPARASVVHSVDAVLDWLDRQ